MIYSRTITMSPIHQFSTPTPESSPAANFHTQAAAASDGGHQATGHQGEESNHHQAGGAQGDATSHASNHREEDEDCDDSHFSDIAQAAARAMEHIDMDKLCSEVFLQEGATGYMPMTHEELEEAVASATGANIESNNNLGGTSFSEAITVTPHVQASAKTSASISPAMMGSTPSPAMMAAAGGLVVTDCASSADGSEESVLQVPSTIAVPAPALTVTKNIIPAALQQPLMLKPKNLSPATKAFVTATGRANTGVCVQGSVMTTLGPALHFSNPATTVGYQQGGQGGAAKKQRSNSRSMVVRGTSQGFPGYNHNFNNLSNSNSNVGRNFLNNQIHSNGRLQAVRTPTHQAPLRRDEVLCAKCQFPGADVRVRRGSGDGGCAYHARCLDLTTLCTEVKKDGGNGGKKTKGSTEDMSLKNLASVEMLPLSFAEMDRVQRTARTAYMNSGLPLSSSMGSTGGVGGSSGGKRSHDLMSALGALPTTIPSHSGAQPPRRDVQCYDPSRPRTGRWTDEEISFRDTLIGHFLAGSLPLSNGLKLNDFLPVMLKSKQSRLAKKMKHAKLSTKYFYPKRGCVSSIGECKELSKMEQDFVNSIPDPVERSEVTFHMSREWREHLANRLASLSINFDGRAWLSSVEDMERRLSFEKERHRLVKRRFMMGKAMEKDCGDSLEKLERGVFVNMGGDGKEEFELVVEKSVSNSAGRERAGSMFPNVGGNNKQDSPGVWSSNEPNFKQAAPFLAGIASYIERNGVPFEHVDVWVPSFIEGNAAKEGSAAANASASGMPTAGPAGNFRLRFGGSVTMGVQIVKDPVEVSTSSGGASGASASTMRRVPLSTDEKSNYSLFGDYSEKFSFDPGCGLPGRIFHSGVPAWEQFVSEAHPSLFERRGGAVQFGVKTAVGLPVDSPNVGRVVLVLYSKYDRLKDEQLVGRMMTDLKLLNPCPRWKLVVDVDSPNGGVMMGEDGRSSLAPPPAGSPVLSASAQELGLSNATPATVPVSAVSSKEKQIKDLILLLGENIPSDPNSPMGPQLQPIMSLRLILLRGSARTTEEDHLIDTVLVLFESYLHAGRSRRDIAVMVARDFAFHLGHQQSLAMRYGGAPPGCPLPQSHPQQQQQQVQAPGPHGNMMYGAVQAPVHRPAPSPLNMGASPLMGPIMNGYGLQPPMQSRSSPPMMSNGSPLLMGTNPIVHYNIAAQQQQYLRSSSMPFMRQGSQSSFMGSPRSTATR